MFQDAGPETENDRGPRVDVSVRGVDSLLTVSRTQLTATRNREREKFINHIQSMKQCKTMTIN